MRRGRVLLGSLTLFLVVAGIGAPAPAGAAAKAPVPDPNATIYEMGSAAGATNVITNPHTSTSALSGFQHFTNLYDRLIQLTPDSTDLAPMLATSWKFNSTGTELTLNLRKDVTFQDGSPFNADVAVANLKAAVAPGSNGSTLTLATMTGVVAVDAYTVKVTFGQPAPNALFDLTGYAGMTVSLNGLANPSTLKDKPAGSGPYKLASVDATLTYKYDRFDGYWNKDHVYPAHYVQTPFADQNTQLNAVRTHSGGASFAGITPQTYDTAKSDPTLQIVTIPTWSPYFLLMNSKLAPLDNPKVREAVSLALDRKAFNAAEEGLCPPVGSEVPKGMDGYTSALKPKYDVAKAKQLVQDAGATGATIKLVTLTFGSYTPFSQIIQAQLGLIGLNIQIDIQPGNLATSLYGQGAYGMKFGTSGASYPDPNTIWEKYVSGQFNPGVKDPALIAQIQKASQLPVGSAERTKALQEANVAVEQQHLWAPICATSNIYVANKNVIGLDKVPNQVFSAAAVWSYVQVAKGK